MVIEAQASNKRGNPVWAVLGNMQLWLVPSLVFIALQLGDWMHRGRPPEGSPLGFLDALRTITFLIGISVSAIRRWRDRINLSRGTAVVLFLVLSWLSGMAFELTLTEEGSRHILLLGWKYFITIQAAYIPLTVLGFFLIRRYHYTIKEVFFAGALTCLYEVAVQGIPMMRAGNALFIPITSAYYMVAYSLIITWPLIIINEKRLWDTRATKAPSWAKIALGIPLGILNMFLYAGWGALLSRMFSNFGTGQ